MVQVVDNYHNEGVDLVYEYMGWLQGYYAEYCIQRGICKQLSIIDSGRVIGVLLYYAFADYVVIYYVIVERGHRGKGYGKALISMLEKQYTAKTLFMASTSSTNTHAVGLFKSLNYTILSREEIVGRYGYSLLDLLTKLMCSYEDDVYVFKALGGAYSLTMLRKLRNYSQGIIELWHNICYKPWIDLFK